MQSVSFKVTLSDIALLPGNARETRCPEVTNPTPSHKRRFARYLFEEDIVIGLLRGQMPTYTDARSIDLAEGGAGVRTSGKLDIGEIVDLQIPLPLGPLRLPACVRYQRGSEYGVEFVALGIPEREYIRNACSSLRRIG
jgi:PilZ domain